MTHLDEIAKGPRPAGSAAARSAQHYSATHLRALGFHVEERPFEYSTLVGRYGLPIVAALLAILLLVGGEVAIGPHRYYATSVAGFCVLLAALWEMTGDGHWTDLPVMRRRAANLEARRGDEPRIWLVAHVDSKSQGIPTALRTAGIMVLALALVAGFVLSATLRWDAPPIAWRIVQLVSIAGATPLLFAVVGSKSDGAVDNATGVAAVLHAASLLPSQLSVGVLITDGEELGLAGAHAWVPGTSPGVAINCDTVDDDGSFVVFGYGNAALTDRAVAVARRVDPAARRMRPLPGVLTDSVPFRHHGWSTVTLSRGTLRTLNRLHTTRDDLRHCRGAAIEPAARILATLVEELT